MNPILWCSWNPRTAFTDRSLSRTRWLAAVLVFCSTTVQIFPGSVFWTQVSHVHRTLAHTSTRTFNMSQSNICSWILFPQKLESRTITKLFTQYEYRELRGNSNIALYKPSEKLARKTPKLVSLMSDEIFKLSSALAHSNPHALALPCARITGWTSITPASKPVFTTVPKTQHIINTTFPCFLSSATHISSFVLPRQGEVSMELLLQIRKIKIQKSLVFAGSGYTNL